MADTGDDGVPATRRGTPRRIVAAAALLIVLSFWTMAGALGFALLAELATMDAPRGWRADLPGVLVVGPIAFLAFAIVQLVAAVGILAGKRWARAIGVLVATVGLIVFALGLAAATVQNLDAPSLALSALLLAGYGFALWTLFRPSGHFAAGGGGGGEGRRDRPRT